MYFLQINDTEWVNVTKPTQIKIQPLLSEVVVDNYPICKAADLGEDVECKEFALALIDWVTSNSKDHVRTPKEVLAAYQTKQKSKATRAKKKEDTDTE